MISVAKRFYHFVLDLIGPGRNPQENCLKSRPKDLLYSTRVLNLAVRPPRTSMWDHKGMLHAHTKLQTQRIASNWLNGCRIVLGFFLPQVLDFFCLSFPVPFAFYLQQFGTRTCHFAWYLLHFGMVTLHFAWYLLHLAMFAFHFAWYLSHFGISTSHLHGICYILVLQTFMWVSWGFFRLSFRVLFRASFGVSFRASFWVSLGCQFRVSATVSVEVSFV